MEIDEAYFGDTVADLERIRNEIGEKIKSVVGVSAKITLVGAKTLPRSEGKAKRVVDNRKLH